IPGQAVDDTESDNGWVSSGFVRSTNLVGQRFVVQVLRFGDRQTVERHAVENGQLTLDIDTSADRRPPLLAVTGFAVRTTQPTNFTLSAEARQGATGTAESGRCATALSRPAGLARASLRSAGPYRRSSSRSSTRRSPSWSSQSFPQRASRASSS